MQASTIAIPFTPDPALLPEGWPDGLAFATRTIHVNGSQLQYLVYRAGYSALNDPRLNHVIGSGANIPNACLSATRWLELDAQKPSDFWPRLQGCTFTKVVEPGNVALQHVCLNADGEELARADYRNESARLALHRVLVNCTDMTFEEFSAISVIVQAQTSGRGTYGSVYADDYGQSAVNKLLATAFKSNESTRQGAFAEALKRKQATASTPSKQQHSPRKDPSPLSQQEQDRQDALKALQQSVTKILLSTPIGDAALKTHEYTTEDGKWVANIIVHNHRFNEHDAMKLAYAQYQKDMKSQPAPAQEQDLENRPESTDAPQG